MWRSKNPKKPLNKNYRCRQIWIWLQNKKDEYIKLTFPCDFRKFIQACKLRLLRNCKTDPFLLPHSHIHHKYLHPFWLMTKSTVPWFCIILCFNNSQLLTWSECLPQAKKIASLITFNVQHETKKKTIKWLPSSSYLTKRRFSFSQGMSLTFYKVSTFLLESMHTSPSPYTPSAFLVYYIHLNKVTSNIVLHNFSVSNGVICSSIQNPIN